MSQRKDNPGAKEFDSSPKRFESKETRKSTYKRNRSRKNLKRKHERRVEAEKERMEKKARLTIAESMSRALIRKCWMCRKRFVKQGGCNSVKCYCGAITCYACGYIISNNLGSRHLTCPSVTLPVEDEAAVQRAARDAKDNLLKVNPKLSFKYDPSKLWSR